MITYPCRLTTTGFVGPGQCTLGTFNFEEYEDLPDPVARQVSIDKEIKKIREACSHHGATHTDGNYYCWIHLPSETKATRPEFKNALHEKLSSFTDKINFRGLYMPNAFGSDSFAGFCAQKDSFVKKVYFTYATFLKPVDFANAVFNDTASFAKAEFHAPVNFHKASFVGGAKFHKTQFRGASNFSNSSFNDTAEFHMAFFGDDAVFREATFGRAMTKDDEKPVGPFNFQKVLFEKEAVFEGATFYTETRSNFLDAKFRDYANFKRIDFPSGGLSVSQTGDDDQTEERWPESAITFEDAEFDSTARFSAKDNNRDWKDRQVRFMQAYFKEPKKIAFRKVKLNPSSFLRTSTVDVEFTDVDWLNTKSWSLSKNFTREASLYFGGPALYAGAGAQARHIFYRFYRTSCRRLALNSEGDNRYNEASRFRRMAFDLERLTQKEDWANWKRRFGRLMGREIKHKGLVRGIAQNTNNIREHFMDLPLDFVHGFYRVLSGYGEGGLQAFAFLFLLWLVSAVFFCNLGTFEGNPEIDFGKASLYSLQVLTLQKPDPKPAGAATMIFYAFETILAPVQLALFALAVRRKFMR